MLVKPLYYSYNLMRDSIGLQDLPQGFAVDAIKCLLEVDEIDIQGHIPLDALLNDVAECKYVVDTSSAPSKTGLLFTEFVVNGIFYSVQDDSAKDFAGDGEKRDPTPVVAILEVSFLRNLDN